MSKTSIFNASVYHLARELIFDGKAGIPGFNEPLEIDDIASELSRRFAVNFSSSDKNAWVDRFITASFDDVSDVEKNSIHYSFKALNAEKNTIRSKKQRWR